MERLLEEHLGLGILAQQIGLDAQIAQHRIFPLPVADGAGNRQGTLEISTTGGIVGPVLAHDRQAIERAPLAPAVAQLLGQS